MDGKELRHARRRKGWTQQLTAEKLGVTQAYFSMAENGHRALPTFLLRKAVELLDATPTALPLRQHTLTLRKDNDELRSQLAALGYPGFAHVSGGVRRNPAEVLLQALNSSELDTRVAESLPWLAWTYADLDWDWSVHCAKVHDLQNRLGFVTSLASRLGSAQSGCLRGDEPRARRLKEYETVLDRSRLAKEDTLCHDSLTEAERRWLRVNRSPEAAHWNLLTDMTIENLPHGRP